MIATVLKKIFGSRNDRLLKHYAQSVRAINALEPEFERLSDAELRAKTDGFQQRLAAGRDARRAAARGLRRRARGRQARAEDAPLRRAADRRHGAAPRQDRRDAHRRGQDADGHAAGLPERAGRQGRARGHRQRLPGPPRRRLDGPALQLPGPDGGREPAADGARREAAGLRRRHHLRHQQRVRLRLPARQHGLRRRRPGAARACLRHRRRGRLDPDRRGAHAADHQRPGRRQHRPVLRINDVVPQAHPPGRRRTGRATSRSTRRATRSS